MSGRAGLDSGHEYGRAHQRRPHHLRPREPLPLRGTAPRFRRVPDGVRRSHEKGRDRRWREAGRRDDPRLLGNAFRPRVGRQPDRQRRVGQRPVAPHRHRLQPPRRPARLEGDRAVGDGPVRLHEEGRPLFRARDHGRQGPRALGALRREGRRGRGRAREREGSLGVRGGDRLAELREGRQGSRWTLSRPTRSSSPTRSGSRAASRRRRRASAACRACSSRSRRARPTSIPA